MTADRIRTLPSLLCAVGAVSLAACQPPDLPGNGAKTATQLDGPAAPERVWESPGKPQAPIDFDYEILGTPMLGQPLAIRLTSSAQPGPDTLDIALSGDGRLLVPAELARIRMARAAGGERSSRTITVTPLVAGTHYLRVLVRADVRGRAQARTATIRIAVGGAGAPPPPLGTVATDATGQRIISLPAQEN